MSMNTPKPCEELEPEKKINNQTITMLFMPSPLPIIINIIINSRMKSAEISTPSKNQPLKLMTYKNDIFPTNQLKK